MGIFVYKKTFGCIMLMGFSTDENSQWAGGGPFPMQGIFTTPTYPTSMITAYIG